MASTTDVEADAAAPLRPYQIEAARQANVERMRMAAAVAENKPEVLIIKRRWLRDFVTELAAVKKLPSFRLQACLDAGRDPEEPLAIPQEDWEDGMVELPRHVAAHIRKMADLTTSVITLSSAVDDAYTKSQVDAMLERLKAGQHAGAGHGDGAQQVDPKAYLLECFRKRERAAITIQRAFRAFRARCQQQGWPSERDPLIMHRRHQAKARYLEGLARHGGRLGNDARAAVVKLRGLAMTAAEAVATKFEEEAQLRAKAGILRAPISGASQAYQLQDREYRIMLLGREFVEEEERQLRMTEEERRRREEQEAQEHMRREQKIARDRQREAERKARLEAEIASQNVSFLDKARMGMLGMSMDGSGNPHGSPDGLYAYRGRTRRQREAEEAQRMEALTKAGMASGEELLRHAVLGRDAGEVLGRIARASSPGDVEAIVKEEVTRLAAARIQQQQQQQQQQQRQEQEHEEKMWCEQGGPDEDGPYKRSESQPELTGGRDGSGPSKVEVCDSTPSNAGPHGAAERASGSGRRVTSGLDPTEPMKRFIPVPSFSNWKPPQLPPSLVSPEGPDAVIAECGGDCADEDEATASSMGALEVTPRALSESHARFLKPAGMKPTPPGANPGAGAWGGQGGGGGGGQGAGRVRGVSPMHSRRPSSTSPSPARVSFGGTVSTSPGARVSHTDPRVPGPTTCSVSWSRPKTAGSLQLPKSPRQSGPGIGPGFPHASPSHSRSPSTSQPTSPHASSPPPRPKTAGAPSPSPMRSRNQSQQSPTHETSSSPARLAVAEDLERAIACNAWWDTHTSTSTHGSGGGAAGGGYFSLGARDGGRLSSGSSPNQSQASGAWGLGQPPLRRPSSQGGGLLLLDPHTLHTSPGADPSGGRRTPVVSWAQELGQGQDSPGPGAAAGVVRRGSEHGSPGGGAGRGAHQQGSYSQGSAPSHVPHAPSSPQPPRAGPHHGGQAVRRSFDTGSAASPKHQGGAPLRHSVNTPSLLLHPGSPYGAGQGALPLPQTPWSGPGGTGASITSMAAGPPITSGSNLNATPFAAGRTLSCSPPCSPVAAGAPGAQRHALHALAMHAAGPNGVVPGGAAAGAGTGPRACVPHAPSPPGSPMHAAMSDLGGPAAGSDVRAARMPSSSGGGAAHSRPGTSCSRASVGTTSTTGMHGASALTARRDGGAPTHTDPRLSKLLALRHTKTSDDVAALLHPNGVGTAAGQQRIERVPAPVTALSTMDEGLWRDFVERVGSV